MKISQADRMVSSLRAELDPLPERFLLRLPIHRGYPVPWFVAWVEKDGVMEPEFRAADARKLVLAIEQKLCWVCGLKTGSHLTFVIGPMCGVNRISGEPPSHYECALWSVRNCPFLSRPQMVRRENDLPEKMVEPGGFMIRRNPQVMLLWTTKSYFVHDGGGGKPLFEIGDPEKVEWFQERRPATREEVVLSIGSGLPALEEKCRSAKDRLQLARMVERLTPLMPPWEEKGATNEEGEGDTDERLS